MPFASDGTVSPSRAFVFVVAVIAVLGLLAGCGLVARDRVLVEGQDWELAVTRGPALQFRQGDSTAGASSYTRPITLNEASTFVTEDGTTLFAGPVTDEAAKVIVATQDGGEAQAELVDSHGMTWFWVQVPGEQAATGFVAEDEAGAVVDESTQPVAPAPPSADAPDLPETILVEPKPL